MQVVPDTGIWTDVVRSEGVAHVRVVPVAGRCGLYLRMSEQTNLDGVLQRICSHGGSVKASLPHIADSL